MRRITETRPSRRTSARVYVWVRCVRLGPMCTSGWRANAHIEPTCAHGEGGRAVCWLRQGRNCAWIRPGSPMVRTWGNLQRSRQLSSQHRAADGAPLLAADQDQLRFLDLTVGCVRRCGGLPPPWRSTDAPGPPQRRELRHNVPIRARDRIGSKNVKGRALKQPGRRTRATSPSASTGQRRGRCRGTPPTG